MATDRSLGSSVPGNAPKGKQGTDGRDPWWDGRNVVIRPDVPGGKFDAGDLVLVRSEDERDQLNVGIDGYAAALEKDSSDKELADWLEQS